jgi:hypothetical protein
MIDAELQTRLTQLTTEDLITLEDELNWYLLSRVRSFSFIEIRLFRKRISWPHYIMRNDMSDECMELASKYFTPDTYRYISFLGKASKDFIMNHISDFGDHWQLLFKSTTVDDDIVFAFEPYWKDRMNILRDCFEGHNLMNDLSDPNLSGVALLLNI